MSNNNNKDITIIDIIALIGSIAIALSIIFAEVINPQLSQNETLNNVIYMLSGALVSVISFTLGKNHSG